MPGTLPIDCSNICSQTEFVSSLFIDEEDNVRIIPAFTQPAPGNRGGLRHAEEEGKQGKVGGV